MAEQKGNEVPENKDEEVPDISCAKYQKTTKFKMDFKKWQKGVLDEALEPKEIEEKEKKKEDW